VCTPVAPLSGQVTVVQPVVAGIEHAPSDVPVCVSAIKFKVVAAVAFTRS
jgi:hypothetical protein